jgi:hypothetical protein
VTLEAHTRFAVLQHLRASEVLKVGPAVALLVRACFVVDPDLSLEQRSAPHSGGRTGRTLVFVSKLADARVALGDLGVDVRDLRGQAVELGLFGLFEIRTTLVLGNLHERSTRLDESFA